MPNHENRTATLIRPGSLSWRVFKNPIAAVLLELAEPRVRTGVWEHTTFRSDPLSRMKRTGAATMITVYGARADAERMIAGIRKMHERISGRTPNGESYSASDPELLNWVHVTASYGFLEAYNAFVRPVTVAEKDRFYFDGLEVAALYGAKGSPSSEKERLAQFEQMLPQLEASSIIFDFLDILENRRLLPFPLHMLQKSLLRASIDILPREVRERLELGVEYDLSSRERSLIGWLGRRTDSLPVSKTVLRAFVRGKTSAV